MEKKSSVDLLAPSSLVQLSTNVNLISGGGGGGSGQTASSSSAAIIGPNSTFLMLTLPLPSTAHQQHTANYTQNLNYLYRIVTYGLIDVFEKHLSSCAIQIFEILTGYLDNYYASVMSSSANLPSSLSSMAAESLNVVAAAAAAAGVDSNVRIQLQQQQQLKYFNYYATIRKEIFEFLLRIRSDRCGKVLLINRVNRRKYKESKCLHLNLINPSLTSAAGAAARSGLLKCEIDFGKILNLLQSCLDKVNKFDALIYC
jgi:hypothetical protein